DWKLLLEATEKTQYPIIKTVWNGVIKNIFVKDENANIALYLLNELKKSIIGILNANANTANKLGAIAGIKEDCSFMEDKYYSTIEGIFDIFNRYTVNGNKFIVAGSTDYYTDYTQTIIDEVERFDTMDAKDSFTVEDMGFLLNITHLYRTYKYNINENNTSPLIGRFNSNKKDFKTIFLPYQIGEKKSIMECLFESSNVLVCDVSRAKKDIRRIMVTFLCAKLYSCSVNSKKDNVSMHLVVDEAHNYLSAQKLDKEDAIAKTCIETFESIIKEGRKFGVFLTMATQRPSDITPTLLSQSHNYVIHKLVNPKDIDIMKNTVPFIDEMSIAMLSILSPGQAIFSGTAFNRPNIVQIKLDGSKTKVESDTIRLMDIWSRKKNCDGNSFEIA
ncbi:MAG: ATP-binding protein, partial [Clostridium sp.]|nr:ATP-binding protein [Clostridium sp.]